MAKDFHYFCLLKIILCISLIAVFFCEGVMLHKIFTKESQWAYSDSLEISRGTENPLVCNNKCTSDCPHKPVKCDPNIRQRFHNIRKGIEYLYIPCIVFCLVVAGFIIYFMVLVWTRASKISFITNRYEKIMEGINPYEKNEIEIESTKRDPKESSDITTKEIKDDKKFVLDLYRTYVNGILEV